MAPLSSKSPSHFRVTKTKDADPILREATRSRSRDVCRMRTFQVLPPRSSCLGGQRTIRIRTAIRRGGGKSREDTGEERGQRVGVTAARRPDNARERTPQTTAGRALRPRAKAGTGLADETLPFYPRPRDTPRRVLSVHSGPWRLLCRVPRPALCALTKHQETCQLVSCR